MESLYAVGVDWLRFMHWHAMDVFAETDRRPPAAAARSFIVCIPISIGRGRRRAEPMAIVADLQTDAAAIDGQVDLHGAGVRVLQRITNALLHITGHRDHGFQRITNADSSGT